MSLNNRKYYIPGETSENSKMRQKAIQSGILVVLVYSYLNTNNERLKQYIHDELLERMDEQDLQLHFEFEDISFAQFCALTSESKGLATQSDPDSQLASANNNLTSPMVTNRQYESQPSTDQKKVLEGNLLSKEDEDTIGQSSGNETFLSVISDGGPAAHTRIVHDNLASQRE